MAVPLRATNVLSYHYDQQSTGEDLTETSLTPLTVLPATFMKRWVRPTDGYVYAQPLYLEGVDITVGSRAGVHDTVFVATEHDSLYALDSTTGDVLWHLSLLTHGLPGAVLITPVPSRDTQTTDLVPQIGVTGTPVIDSSNGYIYVAAKTKQTLSTDRSHPRWVYTLFKVSIGNGSILASNIIAATYVDRNGYEYRTADDPSAAQDPFVFGSGDGNITVNGQSRVYFNALRQMNRPGALLYNGNLYLAFASHGDNSPFHGWLLSFDPGTLALNGVFNTTPNGGLGGIWQAGGIVAVDDEGYFFFMTGNGTFDGNPDGMGGITGLDGNGFPIMGDYGDSILKLALDPTTSQANQNLNGWGFTVVDYFAPMDNQTLSQNDADLGSGGLVILPDSAGSMAHPHLLIGAGKEGKIYLVDRDNMGHYSPYTDNVVQSLADATNGSFNTPAYFNGNFYWVFPGLSAQMFSVSDASFSGTPISQSYDSFNWPGATPTISASGTNNSLIWVINRGPDQLRVYDAQDLTQEYWTSDMAKHSRDKLGPVVKFTTPTVADGFVFVGTERGIYAYGPPPPPTSPPAAPADLSAYAVTGTSVDLSWTNEAQNQGGFSIEDSTNGVSFSQVATVGAKVTETTVGGLSPATFYLFRVRAFNSYRGTSYSGYSNTANATTVAESQDLDFSAGFSGSSLPLNFEGSATATGSFAQLTDGGMNEAGAVWSQQLENIDSFDTEFTFQILPDANGFADGCAFCVQSDSPTQLGGQGNQLGFGGIGQSIAIKFDVYPDLSTTGLYVDGAESEDGAAPAVDVGPSGINFASGDLFDTHLTYANNVLTETITDTVTTAVFTQKYTVSIQGDLDGDTGYVGFTGATGNETSIQQIESWTFTQLPGTVPAAPSGLSATAASSTQIDLAWTGTASGNAGFVVERRKSGANWSYVANVPPGTFTYDDTGLSAHTRYYYIVRATKAIGDSAPSNQAAATTPAVPGPLDVIEAMSVTTDTVNLEWSGVAADADHLILSRQVAGSGRHTVLATLPAGARSYSDNTASAGAHYIYYIQASNLAGPSKAVDVEVTTPAR